MKDLVVQQDITNSVANIFKDYDKDIASIHGLSNTVAGNLGDVLHHFFAGNTKVSSYEIKDLFQVEGALASLDSSYWSKVVSMTDVVDCMPAKRRNEWQDMIRERKTPKFERETVIATINNLLSSRGTFMAEKIDGAIKMWGRLREKLARNGQHLVIRPDSGDPVEMSLRCIKNAEKEFGSSYNSKGYKVLNNCSVIYGDGISDPSVIFNILNNQMNSQYCADNMTFGMGGGLAQMVNRDTERFAIKCSGIIRDGKEVGIFKNPKSDPTKASKKGFLDLIRDVKGNFQTVEGPVVGSCLQTVFLNGEYVGKGNSCEEIRNRVDSNFL